MSTVSVDYEYFEFPAGTPVPGAPQPAVFTLPVGATEPFYAKGELLESDGTEWVLAFASLCGRYAQAPGANADLNTTFVVAPQDAPAVAWYVGSKSGPPDFRVEAFAYSLNKGAVVPNVSPIASTTVPTAWPAAGDNVILTNTGPSSIGVGGVGLIAGIGILQSWVFIADDIQTIKPADMKIPANTGHGILIGVYGIPIPDPCADIRTTLSSLNPTDFPNPQAYAQAFKTLEAQLHACEAKYGE